MNKRLVYLCTLLLSASFFITSCGDSDPCKDVDCGANGTCFEGSCVCNQGYEGSNCDTEWSAKFVGNYAGEDVCNTGTFEYDMSITRVSDSKILLQDLGGTVYDIEADVELVSPSDVSATKISFNYTTGGRLFVGQGTMNGSKITGDYKISQGGTVTDDCSFTLTKK